MGLTLEHTLQPTFLTQRHPPFLRRLIPGYSSARRIALQDKTEDQLVKLHYTDAQIENISHEPVLDFITMFWDASLIGTGLGVAYQAYQTFFS